MLKVISGPMFSEKTAELIRIFNRYKLANKNVIMFKPEKDIRYQNTEGFEENFVTSRTGAKVKAHIVEHDQNIIVPDCIDAVFVDECWLFTVKTIKEFLTKYHKLDIFVTTLNAFFDSKPILTTSILLARADKILFLTSICPYCSNNGSRTYKAAGGAKIEIGDSAYTACCSNCWYEKTLENN